MPSSSRSIVSLSALECGLDTVLAAEPFDGERGGMGALRAKSLALTDLFIALVEERCAGHGLSLVTPREHARRGSQVCLSRDEGAYAIVQALIARNVIDRLLPALPPGTLHGRPHGLSPTVRVAFFAPRRLDRALARKYG